MADMRTLYVEIPASLHRQLRVRAAAEDQLLRDVVAAALAAYLEAAGTSSRGKASQPTRVSRPPRQPPATTGPGSPGYVPPKSPPLERDEPLSEPLPVARDDENPFTDDGTDDDLLPETGG